MRTTEIAIIGCVIGMVLAYSTIAYISWDFWWPAWFATQLPFDRMLLGFFYVVLNCFTCLGGIFLVSSIADDYSRPR